MNVDTAIKSPKYNKDGTIDCEIEHPVFGWIPFTASHEDVEKHGRDIYEWIISNLDVAPFTEPQ